jgi:hypothetical protein
MMSTHDLGARRVATLLVAGWLLLGCLSAPVVAQLERAEYAIEGTWAVQVTPYNCATGVPAPAGFYGIAAFHRGGTATVINSGQTAAAPTTPAVGKWVYTGGRTYTLTTITFVLFGQGVQAWAQRNTMSITLDGDQFTGETRVDFQVVPGSLPPPSISLPPNACARTSATRYP